MRRTSAMFAVGILLSLVTPAAVILAQQMPPEYSDILTFLNRKGDYSDGVLKVGIPRNDLHMTVAGYTVPTALGFGGWIAFTKGEKEMDVMMGDLVLLEDEVNPVMSAILNNGLEVTALHNHFFWEQPRVFYMHVHGHGQALDIAHRVKGALDLIGHVVNPPPGNIASAGEGLVEGKLNTQRLDNIVGHKGDVMGPVYKVTIGRNDITLRDMGARINSRMGLNTWAALYGSDDKAVIAGDVAMLAPEVTPVLKALRDNGLDVVAIHHHMTGTNPTIIFLHYWGVGPAEKLASGFKAAVDQLGKTAPAHTRNNLHEHH